MANKNIGHSFVTLHVGAGTFMPVKVQNVATHAMHSEQVVYDRQLIEDLIKHNGKVVAVGTTSMRSLESLYWFGVMLLADYKSATIDTSISNQGERSNEQTDCKSATISTPISNRGERPFKVEKLYPYSTLNPVLVTDSLQAILDYMIAHELSQLVGETEIMILPSYQFKICKGLITNYHQPESTLMLLVAAFVGNDWRRIYDKALANGYRFLSYGDSSLLLPHFGVIE
jgi:S-adenosylmethionine:tRNA ribosyltransferase-isomerase